MNFKKIGLIAGLLIVAGATLTSCTKSFCTVSDKAAILYSYENYKKDDQAHDEFKEGEFTVQLVTKAKASGMLTPSDEYFAFMEGKIDAYATYLVNNVYKNNQEKYPSDLFDYSYARGIALFSGAENRDDISSYTLWYNYDIWVEEAKKDVADGGIGLDKCPDNDFVKFYKSQLNSLVANRTTCISPETRPFNGTVIEGKSWGEAFSYGLIEGLLVYPVSWLIYTFANAFSVMGGFGTLLAVFLVTLIVRGVLVLATFKQTLSQSKMTSLQPELAKIQQKYPNANTNNYEKQKMGQEQMALYKKYKINPFGMFIVLIVQFPIFIAVWSAMQGSAILMTGEIFGLAFATTTSSALINFNTTWYTTFIAWVIFLLMAAAQFFSMKVPQWRQKKQMKNAQKLNRNPTQDQQTKTMSMVNNIMVIMIIIMGLQLPIAMAIYWFFSALISLGISLLTQKIAEKQRNKAKDKKFASYKTK